MANREEVKIIPKAIAPFYEILQKQLKLSCAPEIKEMEIKNTTEVELDFELVFAPEYVKKRFFEKFTDPYDRFYPFHVPNLLMAATNSDLEIYAYFSKKDGYCTIVALTEPCWKLTNRLKDLLHQLRQLGVSYIELLMGAQHTESLEALIQSQFLPSAFYPAMLETRDGKLQDFVLMTRTMEPLNFREMKIEKSFKPFVDQYLDQWKQMHLDVLGVFHDYT